MRLLVRDALFRTLVSRAKEFPIERDVSNALVLAPHFDDEVLGCGGTIIRMLHAGIEVHVWFLTDGAKSHDHLLPSSEVTEIRQAEAYKATAALGLGADDVTMWAYPDSLLAEEKDRACETLLASFEALRPRLIFAPYRHDGPADHEACAAIGEQMVMRAKHPATMLEYPIWAWHQWPWSGVSLRGRREIPKATLQSLKENYNIFKDWNAKVRIQSCKEQKYNALAEYRSQMTRLMPTERWATLGDIGNGSFLENFQSDYEFFSVREYC